MRLRLGLQKLENKASHKQDVWCTRNLRARVLCGKRHIIIIIWKTTSLAPRQCFTHADPAVCVCVCRLYHIIYILCRVDKFYGRSNDREREYGSLFRRGVRAGESCPSPLLHKSLTTIIYYTRTAASRTVFPLSLLLLLPLLLLCRDKRSYLQECAAFLHHTSPFHSPPLRLHPPIAVAHKKTAHSLIPPPRQRPFRENEKYRAVTISFRVTITTPQLVRVFFLPRYIFMLHIISVARISPLFVNARRKRRTTR